MLQTKSDNASTLQKLSDQIFEPFGQSLLPPHKVLDVRQRNQQDRHVVARKSLYRLSRFRRETVGRYQEPELANARWFRNLLSRDVLD
jgi:hypothetical protein